MKENFEKFKQYLHDIFTTHPKDNGETYGSHFEFAFINGVKGVFIGLIMMIHAIFPFLFTNTATNMMKSWQEKMTARIKNKDI